MIRSHARVATALALTAVVAAAVVAMTAQAQPKRSSGGIKVALIQRFQGGTTYFQDVAKGARAEAKKHSIDLSVQFTNSSDEQLSAIDTAISSGFKGIILNIQDPSLGPVVVKKTKNAGVALLASDDVFKDSSGHSVPVVTLDAKKAGGFVGKTAAQLYLKAGWNKGGEKVGVASIDLPKISTCNQRTNGALSAFLAGAHGFPKANVFHFDYDGTLDSGNTVMSAGLSNHRDVKRWIVWSCNDEGMVGATKAIQNAGISPSNIIGVGLGANLSCNAWRSGKPSSYRAAVVLDPKVNGQSDVHVMWNFLANKKPMPAVTIFPMATAFPSTFKTNRKILPC